MPEKEQSEKRTKPTAAKAFSARTVRNAGRETAQPVITPAAPDPHTGLTPQQAAERMAAGLDNREVASPTKTEAQIIRENIFTFFNLVFVVLAALLAMVGSFANMGFLGVVVCNAVIGIFQQLRSKHAVDKLTLVTVHKVRCLRGGEMLELPPQALVRDDIVEFGAGNRSVPMRWCVPAVFRSTKPSSPAKRTRCPSSRGTACAQAVLSCPAAAGLS